MADTLLFRGGSTASVNASTVSSRELVIDTDTDQIVSGASKKRTVMEQSDGDVYIDGRVAIGTTSPKSQLEVRKDVAGGLGAEIRLSNYAETSPNSTVALKLQPNINSTRWASIEGEQDPAGQTRVNLLFKTPFGGDPVERMRVTSIGDVLIGGTLPSAPNISLNANGSAEFTGDITCSDNSKGLVLKSPDGTSFRLSVANDGTLSASSF